MATEKKQSVLGQVEDLFEEYLYKKTPALPENIREVLVKVTPWVNVIGIVLALMALPVIFAALGLGAVLAPFAALGGAGAVQLGTMLLVSTLLMIPTLVLEIMAAKGLFALQARAWKLIFYVQLIMVVQALITFNIMGIVWALVFIYLLFQIRSSFNK